jgi:hypothetical protein
MSLSRPLTSSVISLSTSSRPANTSITSALGLVYFLLSMALKKAVRVFDTVSRFDGEYTTEK